MNTFVVVAGVVALVFLMAWFFRRPTDSSEQADLPATPESPDALAGNPQSEFEASPAVGAVVGTSAEARSTEAPEETAELNEESQEVESPAEDLAEKSEESDSDESGKKGEDELVRGTDSDDEDLTETAAEGSGFIPENEKAFLFDPGDVLLSQAREGYTLIKVLQVERVDMAAGDKLKIADQVLEAPSADHFLVVNVTLGEEVSSETQALEALANGKWTKTAHAPMRPSVLNKNELKKIGSKQVTDDEKKLVGDWYRAFETGDAGLL